MMKYLISAHGVGLVIGDGEARTVILDDISLAFEKGEFVSIMGPSGSGKSSLMNILGGLLTPTSGTVEADGIDIYSLDSEKRADFRRLYIGFVFQSFHLFPYLTVLENVLLPRIKDDVPREEKVEAAIELFRSSCFGKSDCRGRKRGFRPSSPVARLNAWQSREPCITTPL
jgi:putative ABC transport system ATP-binding protein